MVTQRAIYLTLPSVRGEANETDTFRVADLLKRFFTKKCVFPDLKIQTTHNSTHYQSTKYFTNQHTLKPK